ncbi:MAG: hypothetical protein U5Q03_00835 [Bacteroidota bacterium]|nr:hypothetical protein [Bacteroidota bacterium]
MFAIFLICSHVSEHIENDKKAISELYRITVQGGAGFLMVPTILSAISKTIENIPDVNTDEDRWKYYGQNDHVRLYAKSDFVERIKEDGFILHHYDLNYLVKELINKHE